MKRFGTIFLAILAIIVFASWQYRLLYLLLIVIINRKWFKEKLNAHLGHTYRTLVIVITVLIFACLPNYWQRGRTQLHYLDANGKRANTPALVYIANVIFPEKEVMNLCMKAVAICPKQLIKNNRFAMDAKRDFWRGRAWGFYKPYNHLSLQGSNPGSFAIAQTMNQVLKTQHDAIYITRPTNFDAAKTYPVVVFCHGYMGSWELYQGIFSRLKNCIVVSIGTRDLGGNSFSIKKIFSKYLPYLESLGYSIDYKQLHLIGLSNGGQASKSAWKYYDDKFKTITFLSTGSPFIKKSQSKVLLIGGNDCNSMPMIAKQLNAIGTKTAIYHDNKENHYILTYHTQKIIQFLNKEMELID